MTQRKHSGGQAGRKSPGRSRADSAKRSAGPDGAYGKRSAGPAGAYGGGKPSHGKASFAKGSFGKSPSKAGYGKTPGGKAAGKSGFSKARPGRGQDDAPQHEPRQGHWAGAASPASRPDKSGTGQPRFGKSAQRPDTRSERPAKPARLPEQSAAPRAEKPARLERNQVWLYGLHAVKAALANPIRQFHRLLLSRDASEDLYSYTSQINNLTPEILTRDEIGRLLPAGAVHQGAALLADTLRPIALEDVIDQVAAKENTLIVILDQVTDPQNVGAILRSAAAFGASAVVMPERHAPPETGALVKAASGAVELVPLVRVINLARAMADLKAAGFWIAGLDGQAPQSLAAADMTGKVALVLGAEGEGLRRLTRDHCDILVRLPISERMESLNVSAAAAVAMYELARKG